MDRISFANAKLSDYCSRNLRRLRPHVSHVFIIHDARLPESLLRQVIAGVKASNCPFTLIKAAHGERNKTLASAEKLVTTILKAKADRDSLVLAVGGGVTSDLSGFAAAITLRGIRWACLPTTLLSMVDAGIGGKTAVNTGGNKNMIGAFHFPQFIHIDFRWLKSLPDYEFSSGLGELQKTALLAGGRLWRACQATKPAQFRKSTLALHELIKLAARYKNKIVSSDPKEANLRKILNLGHTFGHPIEMASAGKLSHGEAVSFGIHCALQHSAQLGLCKAKLLADNDTLCARMGLDQHPKLKLPTAAILRRALAHDKKSRDGKLSLVLLEKAGHPLVCDGYSVAEVAKIIIANRYR
ncbi:MAG: 3-dehydroquinate synthase [Myxococcota bacterium]|jgi:3-dehydroquinate synthase